MNYGISKNLGIRRREKELRAVLNNLVEDAERERVSVRGILPSITTLSNPVIPEETYENLRRDAYERLHRVAQQQRAEGTLNESGLFM